MNNENEKTLTNFPKVVDEKHINVDKTALDFVSALNFLPPDGPPLGFRGCLMHYFGRYI